MQQSTPFSASLAVMTDSERLGFQLSLLNLVYQGNVPPETSMKLEECTICQGAPLPN